MVIVWGGDDNVTILDVGVLLSFWSCMVWFGCNGRDVI